VNQEELLRMFPGARINPFDGMAVTAEVWEEAHAYHCQHQHLHALFSHGPGIVTGLEVIASDPPDNAVYIRPGLAVDPLGRMIMLREPTAYDLGDADGWLHVLLSYGESRPRTDAGRDGEGGPLYVYTEFSIGAGPVASATEGVELARLRRPDGGRPIQDAQDAAHPGPNEIDLRFRRRVGAAPQQMAALGVVYAGGVEIAPHGQGMAHLARALRRAGEYCAWVDLHAPLTSDPSGRAVRLSPHDEASGQSLAHYTLVYLVGKGPFELNPAHMQVLYDYVRDGGTLLVESCRRDVAANDPAPADAAFHELLSSLGFSLQALPAGHALLVEPFLFAAPPPGFDAGSVQVGEGVIFSTCDYGCLWTGAQREGLPSRQKIRSAMEWGENIVAYALARRLEIRD